MVDSGHINSKTVALAETSQNLKGVEHGVLTQESLTYAFAAHLLRRGGYRYIIDIGLRHAKSLLTNFADAQIIGLGEEHDVQLIQRSVRFAQLFCVRFSQPFELPQRWTEHSIVICHGVLEILSDPVPLLKSLKQLSEKAPYVLISRLPNRTVTVSDSLRSSQHGTRRPQLSVVRIKELMFHTENQCSITGYTGVHHPDEDNDASGIILTGKHTQLQARPVKRVCALIACYNDVDVIESCYRHLKSQGVDMCFIDDWSSDGTWDVLSRIRRDDPTSCVHLERSNPAGSSSHLDSEFLLKRKEVLSKQLDYDWFIHQDPDELRYSFDPDFTLAAALAHVDALGFNAIDHTVLNFRPTDSQYDPCRELSEQFSYFEFDRDLNFLKQVKCFKKQPDIVDMRSSNGHNILFPNRRIFPFNFLIAHYPLRSTEQAHRRLFCEMLPRTTKERDARGLHTHLEKSAFSSLYPTYVWPRERLHKYEPGEFHNRFFFERLMGINDSDG